MHIFYAIDRKLPVPVEFLQNPPARGLTAFHSTPRIRNPSGPSPNGVELASSGISLEFPKCLKFQEV